MSRLTRSKLLLATALVSCPLALLIFATRDSYLRPYLQSYSSANSSNTIVDLSREPCSVAHDLNNTILYQCFPLPSQSQNPLRNPDQLDTLLSLQDLPQDACLDANIADGSPCFSLGRTTVDVVWTWINGSDQYFRDSLSRLERETEVLDKPYGIARKPILMTQNGAKQYRDHDELRHSLRSVLKHFRNYVGKLLVFTADMEHPVHGASQRIGLVPQWLNASTPEAWVDGKANLAVQHHSHAFWEPGSPSFNSFSIEAQFLGLRNVSQQFVYMNDDFFFTRDLSTADFYTPEYGYVIRCSPELLVDAEESPTPGVHGEWGPLKYSNWLLSQRFGWRKRPYLAHIPKILSMPHLAEISSIWRDEIIETSMHPFRGKRDVYLTFLFTHFVVERWRELLLWSWVIGRVGGADDSWGMAEQQRAWDELGGKPNEGEIRVTMQKRNTLIPESVRERIVAIGDDPPTSTEYLFSSLDGYPYGLIDQGSLKDWPRIANGSLTEEDEDLSSFKWANCKILLNRCFANKKSASDVFKFVAFKEPQGCGDCIIAALVNASGKTGLSAFLPPLDRTVDSLRKRAPIAQNKPSYHLPMTKNWDSTDFTLRSIMVPFGGGSVRDWIVHSLNNYRFVISSTPHSFIQMNNWKQTEKMLAGFDKDELSALLSINDDIRYSAHNDQTDNTLRTWLGQRWSEPAAWEV